MLRRSSTGRVKFQILTRRGKGRRLVLFLRFIHCLELTLLYFLYVTGRMERVCRMPRWKNLRSYQTWINDKWLRAIGRLQTRSRRNSRSYLQRKASAMKLQGQTSTWSCSEFKQASESISKRNLLKNPLIRKYLFPPPAKSSQSRYHFALTQLSPSL